MEEQIQSYLSNPTVGRLLLLSGVLALFGFLINLFCKKIVCLLKLRVTITDYQGKK
jgi:membrane-bound ClpP family serine protease